MSDVMDGQMPGNFPAPGHHYRLYFMDRADGHIGHLREFECPTDESAIVAAECIRADCPMELWRDSKKIKRWERLRRYPDPDNS